MTLVSHKIQESTVEIRQAEVFSRWFERLRDREARARIVKRNRRLTQGNLGDSRPVGEGVSEIRIHYGPGYHVYFVHRGKSIIILTCGW